MHRHGGLVHVSMSYNIKRKSCNRTGLLSTNSGSWMHMLMVLLMANRQPGQHRNIMAIVSFLRL